MYDKFIVTSNYGPWTMFEDVDYKAIEARFKLVEYPVDITENL